MCGVWTHEQWHNAASKPDSKYSVIGTFQNAEEQTAIQVKELGGMFSDFYWNVYSEDGEDANVYTASDEAYRRMEARGFTPVTAGVGFLVETETPATAEPVRVQGKTLEEWEEIGKQNEELPEELRIHPVHPRQLGEDRDSTDEEMQAFVNSLTIDEAMESLSTILGAASASA